MQKLFLLLCGVVAVAMLWGCASIGNPTGGPRDEDPPRFVAATPAPGTVNFDGRRAVIRFNELVNVRDAFSKVVISPTSAQPPKVTSQGRNVYIEFSDTLEPNTTYTVDFGNAIEDNNEGNKLQGFTYSFATGPSIDTLRIAGMVLGARDLEPQQSMLVGVYRVADEGENVADTTFRTTRLERIAKTDDRGRFIIRGLAPGHYRLFALADANNDYRWDNPQEDIAYTSYTIYPTTDSRLTTDTIYDMYTGRVDSTLQRMRTVYLPNDVLLNAFNIGFRQQYLVKNERMDSTRISLIFNAPADTLPTVSIVNLPDRHDWYRLEHSATNDTLTYWITDPTVINTDTLRLALAYRATDAKNTADRRTLIDVNDTLRLLTQRPRAVKNKGTDKKKKTAAEDSIKPLGVKVNASSTFDVRSPLTIEFDEPPARLDTAAFRLSVKVDTVWRPLDVPYVLEQDSPGDIRRYSIKVPWQYETTYRLEADSLAAEGIYGRPMPALSKEFTVKKQADYFNLTFNITGLPDTIPGFVELLDRSDKPLRTAPVEHGQAVFRDVPTGQYYARLVEDRNGNGLYDTGDYELDRQPEYVYYYPKSLKINKRWDVVQAWNILDTAIDKQKPEALKKNKPERDKRQKSNTQTEDEEDEVFDPTANPFDPNDKARRQRQRNQTF